MKSKIIPTASKILQGEVKVLSAQKNRNGIKKTLARKTRLVRIDVGNRWRKEMSPAKRQWKLTILVKLNLSDCSLQVNSIHI